jgi:hypothetical protein
MSKAKEIYMFVSVDQTDPEYFYTLRRDGKTLFLILDNFCLNVWVDLTKML